jgi:hypothetical protein
MAPLTGRGNRRKTGRFARREPDSEWHRGAETAPLVRPQVKERTAATFTRICQDQARFCRVRAGTLRRYFSQFGVQAKLSLQD